MSVGAYGTRGKPPLHSTRWSTIAGAGTTDGEDNEFAWGAGASHGEDNGRLPPKAARWLRWRLDVVLAAPAASV